ncbi:MAG: NADH-quinone oxidoreductase subunit N [Aquificaceae bacterium]|nr:NADH-quinone oxidoreductase subunit N [Aquificaceae bacterium]MCX8059953.1 NADH-quinone oxidoreductase subunit N [Aquificaceae bacterium]MDW8097810.1 NADH-quinone oxidoreductase subunit N [Aquificaceae bacterium]
MNWNALLPELLLSFGTLFVFILDLFATKKHYRALSYLSAFVPVASLLSLFFVEYPAKGFFDLFHVNAVNLLGKAVLYALTSLLLFAMHDYYERKNSVYTELSYLPLLATLGLSLLISSANVVLLLLSLELASISMYLMVALLREEYMPKEAGYKYLILGAVGTSMFALGSAFYYASTGSLFFKEYRDENTLFLLSTLLILSALALKASAVPYHFWTPDAYEGAPTPIAGYLSSAPKVAIYFLLVQLLPYFHHLKLWLILVAVLSLLSMFYANLVAYAQRSVKRLLAYSTVAHAGYFFLGIATLEPQLQKALLFYVSLYAFASLGSFVLMSALEKREGFSHHLLDYRGLYREHPLLASVFALFLFAFIGIPPMALFVGKLTLFMGLVQSLLVPLALAFLVASIVSAGYYLRVVVFMFLEEGERRFPATKVSGGEALTLIVCSLLVLILGLFPHILYDLFRL